MRNARTKSPAYRRRTRKTTKVAMYRDPDLIGVVNLEASFYVTLTDSTNTAQDLFTAMAQNSNDYSQYRDIYSQFRMLSVQFDIMPASINSTVNSDISFGLFGVKQGLFENTPATVSVLTLQTYPGSEYLHNMIPKTYKYKIYPSYWFQNNETQALNAVIPKVTFYCSWYKLGNTNTNQGLIRARVYLQARGKIV